MTEDHAALLRCWAMPPRHMQGDETFRMADLREQRPYLTPDRCLALARQMEAWGLATITQPRGFGGPYGKPTPDGRQWLEDNPQ